MNNVILKILLGTREVFHLKLTRWTSRTTRTRIRHWTNILHARM